MQSKEVPSHIEGPVGKPKFDGTVGNVSKEVQAHVEQAAQEELGEGGSAWQSLTRNPRAFVVLAIVLSTAITNGIELSMSGSMLGSQAFCKVMGSWDETSAEYVVAAGHVSAWTAAAIPGQFAGIYLSGIFADRYGRKYVVQGSMVIVFIGALIETFSKNWIEWLVSKAIMGMATGTIQACVSTYVAEVSPRELRGGALIGYQIFSTFLTL